jgi:iron complex transport system ATP-binding protein
MGRTPYLGVFETPSRRDTELAYSIMEDLGIAHLAEKSYTHISGGERQLVLIARTLCQEPEIILFDEPTSHLDFKNQAIVLRTIKQLSEKGMTIVMTSHFPNHVWKIGTHVAMLGFKGMVVQGLVNEVMTEE